MSGSRPLLKARVDELEALFREKGHDVPTLHTLTAELLRRDSPRAHALLIKTRARLGEVETGVPQPTFEGAPGERSGGQLSGDLVSGDPQTIDFKEGNGSHLHSVETSEELMRPLDLPIKPNQKALRLNASDGAKWLHEVSKLFGTSALNLHMVEIFLRVAQADRSKELLDSSKLARLTGVSISTVSRNIGRLGTWARNGTRGMGLISALPDNPDRRRKPLRLTPKGRQLLRMLEDL